MRDLEPDEGRTTADDAREVPAAGVIMLVAIAALTITLALWLFPFDCDAAFAVHDPVWYGMLAERTPAQSINPNHPLFHVLVLAVTEPLKALHVEAPGHLACRVVAALGAAWLVIQVAFAAGRRRLAVGCLFALVLFASRSFIWELASGENVLPATAAALFAIRQSARRDQRLWWTIFALVLALLFRQDNITIVPGVALGVALANGQARFRRVLVLLLGSGLITAAIYVGLWLVTMGGRADLITWALGVGQHGPFTGPNYLDLSRLQVYASTFAVSLTGRLWAPGEVHPWLAAGYAALMLGCGVALRGAKPTQRLALPIAMTLLVRALFFTWFEADNHEWLVLSLSMLLMYAAGWARGEPATALPWRGAGVALLLVLVAWVVVAHAPSTWALRERALTETVRDATQVDLSRWRVIAASLNADTALTLLEVPHTTITTRGDLVEAVVREVGGSSQPTIVLWDRGIIDGMPSSIRDGREAVLEVDTMTLPPPWEKILRRGQLYGVRWNPG